MDSKPRIRMGTYVTSICVGESFIFKIDWKMFIDDVKCLICEDKLLFIKVSTWISSILDRMVIYPKNHVRMVLLYSNF